VLDVEDEVEVEVVEVVSLVDVVAKLIQV